MELISFVNYGILYLFDLMKCSLSGSPIETVFNPVLVANILGLATFPDNFKQGLLETWCPDTSAEIATTNLGFRARQEFILSSTHFFVGNSIFRLRLELLPKFGN